MTSHTRLHTEEKGMTSFLAGKATTDEIIKHNEICENLDFIPAGPIAPNPSELLLSEQLEVMIAELRNRYDYIFVDNVPVGVVADAAITNRIADLTIFVVRVGKLDRRMLPELEKIYRSGQLNNMSLVLNGAIVKTSGYGGYGYGYGSVSYTHLDVYKRQVMHRIYNVKNEEYYLIGDAQTVIEGPIQREQIFAIIIKVKRKGKWLSLIHI